MIVTLKRQKQIPLSFLTENKTESQNKIAGIQYHFISFSTTAKLIHLTRL